MLKSKLTRFKIQQINKLTDWNHNLPALSWFPHEYKREAWPSGETSRFSEPAIMLEVMFSPVISDLEAPWDTLKPQNLTTKNRQTENV